MRKTIIATASAALLLSAAPVRADWHPHTYYNHGYYHHHRGIGPGAALGLGLGLGALGGALLAEPRAPYYVAPPPPPPPIYVPPQPGYYIQPSYRPW